jgi:hypothetical protein
VPREPDPADVDVSGRGETQPSDPEATERFTEQAERQERHNEPSRDPGALYGPAGHDESSEATVGKGPDPDRTVTSQTDESEDEHPDHPGQPRPS